MFVGLGRFRARAVREHVDATRMAGSLGHILERGHASSKLPRYLLVRGKAGIFECRVWGRWVGWIGLGFGFAPLPCTAIHRPPC